MNRLDPSCSVLNQHELSWPSWPVMNCHEPSWTFMKYHEPLWTFMKYPEPSWTVLNGDDLLWTILNSHELSWAFMNHNEQLWIIINHRELSWINTNCPLPGGYEVYRIASYMPKSKKSCKPLQANFLFFLLSNQKEIMKRGMTWTEQKTKSTTFKVQSLATANPWYIDLIHQCVTNCHTLSNVRIC